MRLRLRKSTPAAKGRTGCDRHMTVQVTSKPCGGVSRRP